MKILIADDHPLLTAGLKLAVEGWEEFTLVGAAASGEDRMLWARNKWLLAHPESRQAKLGAWIGLRGRNIDLAD